jgi:hypothetical protein
LFSEEQLGSIFSKKPASFETSASKTTFIPFVRIQDFKKDFASKVNEMLQDFEAHQKDVKALRLLELKEEQFHQNINLINDMRRVILHRYCKKN